MGLTVAGQNSAADGVAGDFTFAALFNGDPEGAGTELTGGSPAYARQAVTFGAASGGSAAGTGSPVVTFDIPAGATFDYWALYSAVTGGTLGAAGALSGSESYGSQGTYDFNTFVLDPQAT